MKEVDFDDTYCITLSPEQESKRKLLVQVGNGKDQVSWIMNKREVLTLIKKFQQVADIMTYEQ